MSYHIKPLDDRTVWEQFLYDRPVDSFLHTWEWGEFNKKINTRTGEDVIRFGVYEDEQLIGLVLLLKIVAKRGSYLFCPHGPILSHDTPEVLEVIINKCIEFAKQEKVDFLRFSPLLLDTPEHRSVFSRAGFRDAPIHVHPELAWILDITPTPDELLAQMRKTSRHAIRKAMKDGVIVRESTSKEDLTKFHALYTETVERQNFTPFSINYLEQELETFLEKDRMRIFVAEYNGEPVASSMVVFTPYSAFYHQGASSRKHSKLTAAHLLQWTAINAAQKRGCKRYNFWGIVDDSKPNHPWKGLSLFKKGFGGYSQAYVHAQDKPLTAKYWLNYAVETFRRRKRGY